jgi:hypothetical protein
MPRKQGSKQQLAVYGENWGQGRGNASRFELRASSDEASVGEALVASRAIRGRYGRDSSHPPMMRKDAWLPDT